MQERYLSYPFWPKGPRKECIRQGLFLVYDCMTFPVSTEEVEVVDTVVCHSNRYFVSIISLSLFSRSCSFEYILRCTHQARKQGSTCKGTFQLKNNDNNMYQEVPDSLSRKQCYSLDFALNTALHFLDVSLEFNSKRLVLRNHAKLTFSFYTAFFISTLNDMERGRQHYLNDYYWLSDDSNLLKSFSFMQTKNVKWKNKIHLKNTCVMCVKEKGCRNAYFSWESWLLPTFAREMEV